MIRVRRAAQHDATRLVEIARHSVTAAQWQESQYTSLVADQEGSASVALVIEEDGLILGFLAGRRLVGDEWEIENVAIHGEARRRGLGSHLLGEFLNMVRRSGGSEIYLEVRESNRAARALYEKWAFVEAGRRQKYYQDPSEDALILKFSFPAPQ
jgi:ribosomal-protein-alanine N-acetyltransferase